MFKLKLNGTGAARRLLHLPAGPPTTKLLIQTPTWDIVAQTPVHWVPVARACDVWANPNECLLVPQSQDKQNETPHLDQHNDRMLFIHEELIDKSSPHGTTDGHDLSRFSAITTHVDKGEVLELATWGSVNFSDTIQPINQDDYRPQYLVPPLGKVGATLQLRASDWGLSHRFILQIEDTPNDRRTRFVFEAPQSCFRGCWIAAGRLMLSSFTMRRQGATYLPAWQFTLPSEWDPLKHVPRPVVSLSGRQGEASEDAAKQAESAAMACALR